jgi:hypothetical protein
MDNQQTWVEALNISSDSLEQWSSQAPQGTPLLVWCLEEGHVSVAEYLTWASAQFELAVVTSDFFASEIDADFVANHRTSDNWSSWCFPVSEWDGTLFVACIEPPVSEMQPGVKYVLADPRAMRIVWDSAQPAIPHLETPEPPAIPNEGPTGLNTSPTKIFQLNLDNISLGETEPADYQAPQPVNYPQVPDDEPAAQAGGFVLNLEGTAVGPAFAVSQDPPTQLDYHIGQQTRVNIPTPPPPLPLDASDSVELDEPTQVPDEDATPKPKVTHAADVRTASVDLGAAFGQAMVVINRTFEHSCVLRFQDSAASIFRVDDSLKVAPETPEISLDYPSFLRIVSRTALPYHGYLVDSPAHRDFFSALGYQDLPKCVSAVPLKLGPTIWGVLLAIGNESHQTIEALRIVEAEAEKLLKHLVSGTAKAS